MKARTLNLKKIYVQHNKKKKNKNKTKKPKKKTNNNNNYKFWTFISNLSYKMFDGRSSS